MTPFVPFVCFCFVVRAVIFHPIFPMRTTTLFQALLLSLLTGTVSAVAAGPLPRVEPSHAGFAPERLERLHAFTRGLVTEKKYSGLTTLLVRDGKIVDWLTFGERTAGVPLKQDDIFAIASLTKIVATVGALMLVEEGRLGLNDPIAEHLPEFRNPKVLTSGSNQPPVFADAVRPITLKHLLTHTAGLSTSAPLTLTPPKPEAGAGSGAGREFATLAERILELSEHALTHQPGEAWVYGPATDVVGRLVEVVAAKPFDVFLRERVFDPLKMRDTAFEVPSEKRSRQVATDVRQDDGSLRSVPPKSRQQPWPSGSGGLFSTPADYVRFAQMLLNGGELDGVRLLSPKTVELMTIDHLHGLAKPTKIYPVSDGFGFGVEVRTDVARSGWLGSQGTYGWNGATTCYCSFDPKERLIAMIWAQHTPNAEFQLYERFNTLVYQALVR
jgi:CubicO group peptidase (beta-lactamase class C family)